MTRLKHIAHALLFIVASPLVFAEPLTGAMQGSVRGTVEDESGAMVVGSL